ncbi:hypothetical protein MARA_00590 (plasmid) [Mycolicibacterium arabiense]|uniref:2Fe-2S ferredoxin-type domain-containing protein n=1 Tax=Mycolicibacterium arabiense TaxID=1286181 RepID=A0A7I7RRL0_9MYCO|nr:ferritin-like domain-containing protein [Mycolicibacterium arabiense]MCV7372041.1 hypothetical protein [Mycolicibacterium arabiense]BBY46629.1 hypothetical protein MARA_00590 [Mycolicibacterium arabiense]
MNYEPTVALDIIVNGEHHHGRRVAADMTLVHFLHEDLGLTGTKIGCSIGECRACTVAVQVEPDGPPVTRQACMTGMRHTAGWKVTTIEGLGEPDELNPVQKAIFTRQAFQCGYCAAGFAVAGTVALAGVRPGDDAKAVERRVDAVLGPHLCRCTGYGRYRDAILSAAPSQAAAPEVRLFASPPTGLNASPAMRPSAAPIARPVMQALTKADTDELGYTPVFDDPTLELVRLLRDGAEIEHSLLVQYLYAAFSVKLPDYAQLAGWPNHRYGGRPLHVIGVAIEEMTHLDVVNELLVALGAAPHLGRQQFPYETDIYPFDFTLEPLNLHSIAKYLYVEASTTAVDLDAPQDPEHRAMLERLYAALNSTAPHHMRPNQVGSLYRKVVRVLKLLEHRHPSSLDYDYWGARLGVVLEEGEHEHFDFFRTLFDGTHPALPAGGPDIWDPTHPEHPVLALKLESGLPRSGEPIVDELLPAMRHLSNLHYWAVCMLLDLSYRHRGRFHSAARRHMTGPLRSLGSALATHGHGVPFDAFVAGYAPGLDSRRNLELAVSMLQQTLIAQQRYARHLPPDYAHTCVTETLWELSDLC